LTTFYTNKENYSGVSLPFAIGWKSKFLASGYSFLPFLTQVQEGSKSDAKKERKGSKINTVPSKKAWMSGNCLKLYLNT
jgi:hypothetical protein